MGTALSAGQINFVKTPDLLTEREAFAKIRYKDPGAPCVVWQEDNILHVRFTTPRRAITPGQAIVLYDGDEVLAGAWIIQVEHPETVVIA